jgi:hypothetical protein
MSIKTDVLCGKVIKQIQNSYDKGMGQYGFDDAMMEQASMYLQQLVEQIKQELKEELMSSFRSYL